MSDFRCDYEIVGQCGNGFKQEADRVNALLRDLTSKADPLLGGGWIGMGEKSFAQDFEKCAKEFQKLIKALSFGAEALDKCGKIFQSGEQESQQIVISIKVS